MPPTAYSLYAIGKYADYIVIRVTSVTWLSKFRFCCKVIPSE